MLLTVGSRVVIFLTVFCSPSVLMAKDVVRYHLNHKVWVKPIQSSVAYVYVNYRVGDKVVGRSLSDSVLSDFRAHPGMVAFGRAGTKNVAVVGPKATAGRLERKDALAIAAHETFHLLVQDQGFRPRFDMAQEPPPLSKEDGGFAFRFFTILSDVIGGEKPVCPILDRISSFDPNIRQWVFYKTYIEWPAEWYMRHSVLGDSSFASYFARRERWGGGRANMLYVSGVRALDHVDRRLGRSNWQSRYIQGAHPLNLVAESYGCRKPVGPSFQVVKWELLDIFAGK